MDIEQKRREIREGLTVVFSECYSKEGSACPLHPVFQPQKAINELFKYLDSQGVGIIDKEAVRQLVFSKHCLDIHGETAYLHEDCAKELSLFKTHPLTEE